MERFSNEELLALGQQWPLCRVWLTKPNKKEAELNLTASKQLMSRTPGGFSWGGWHSGAFQLAFAICLELFEEYLARRIYNDFMETYLLPLARDEDFNVEFDISEFIVDHLDDFFH